MDIIRATLHLYHHALQQAIRSLVQCWMVVLAMFLFAFLMMVATTVAVSLGFLGGFILGAANAFVVGWTLSLVELAVKGSRRLGWQDIWRNAGSYFWDVITIGFIVFVPLQIVQMGMETNPYGPVILSGVFLLLFILLNPVPEVIYQGRYGSPLDTMKESYEFVIENWIEWFLPLALVLAPLGLLFFFGFSSQGGRMGGLDFFQLFRLPFEILTTWFRLLGMSSAFANLVVLVLTPIATVFMLFFRGHLFAALQGSSRRQRLFNLKSTR